MAKELPTSIYLNAEARAALDWLREQSGGFNLAGYIHTQIVQLATERGWPGGTTAAGPERDVAFLLGQLLAAYDALSVAASGGRTSVADATWARAAAFPRPTFPQLERQSRQDLQRLRRSADDGRKLRADALESRITELQERLGLEVGNFPAALSLEEQGRFIMGFHRERAATRRPDKGGR
jgi:hypothetical protein